jgi:hypothetical protein
VTITVHIVDAHNPSKPVQDANVRLAGPGNYSDTTDASGNATFHVAEIGTFTVTISQEHYEPGGSSIRVLQGRGRGERREPRRLLQPRGCWMSCWRYPAPKRCALSLNKSHLLSQSESTTLSGRLREERELSCLYVGQARRLQPW